MSLIVVLLAAPLAFGAVKAWAWGAMAIVVGLVSVLWAAGCAYRGAVRVIWSALYVPILALMALAIVQYAAGLTLDRIGTREALIKGVLFLLIFFLVQQLYFDLPGREWMQSAAVAAVYMVAMAVFAIVQSLAAPGSLYGIIRPRWGGYVAGPYVNHNHYAGLMEMLIPVTVALAARLMTARRFRRLLLPGVFIAILSVALSGSRGGLIAMVVEFAILGLLMLTGNGIPRHSMAVLAVCASFLVAGACLIWVDPGGIWKRWEVATRAPERALDLRVNTTPDALRMSLANLSYGVGIGAFETAYPRYQSLVSDHVVDFAHNDYAQLAAEAGIWAWILVPVAIALFVWLAFRYVGRKLLTDTGWLQLGAAAGVCGILVHSFSDFNLHIPANAAWFAASAALATLRTSS